jgi:hypothetical protein
MLKFLKLLDQQASSIINFASLCCTLPFQEITAVQETVNYVIIDLFGLWYNISNGVVYILSVLKLVQRVFERFFVDYRVFKVQLRTIVD